MADPQPKSSKTKWILILLVIALIAGGAFWFRTMMIHEPAKVTSATPLATPDATGEAAPQESAQAEAEEEEPQGAVRPAIILTPVDGLSEPFKADAAKIASLLPGDRVSIIGQKSQAGADGKESLSYQTEKQGWLSSDDVFLFDNLGLYDSFLSSTGPLSELAQSSGLAPSDVEKWKRLDSSEFLLACAKNPENRVATACMNRIIYFLQPNEIVPAWFAIVQVDLPNLQALDSNLDMGFTAGRFDAVVDDFKQQFPKLSTEMKAKVFQKTCLAAADMLKVAIPIAAKDKEEVFQAMLSCLSGPDGKTKLENMGGLKQFEKGFPPKRLKAFKAALK